MNTDERREGGKRAVNVRALCRTRNNCDYYSMWPPMSARWKCPAGNILVRNGNTHRLPHPHKSSISASNHLETLTFRRTDAPSEEDLIVILPS